MARHGGLVARYSRLMLFRLPKKSPRRPPGDPFGKDAVPLGPIEDEITARLRTEEDARFPHRYVALRAAIPSDVAAIVRGWCPSGKSPATARVKIKFCGTRGLFPCHPGVVNGVVRLLNVPAS